MNMFTRTITVYNKYKDGISEKWQRTVIKGTYWNSVKGAIVRKTGVSSVDSLQLIIPFSAIPDKAKIYMPPKEWAKLEDKSGHWTLQSGDTIIKGDISYEIIKTSAELKDYDDCLAITNVDTKDFNSDMSHWEVSAK